MPQDTKPETLDVLTRLRRGALWLLFAAVLLIPKIMALRRRPRVWNGMRMAAIVLGLAASVAGFAALHKNPGRALTITAGALLVVLALTIPAEQSAISSTSSQLVDLRARQLGALVVVDGGEYLVANNQNVSARIFVSAERLWVLNTALDIVAEIPVPQIAAVRVERESQQTASANEIWNLVIAGEQVTASFVYCGHFAEHLARVAEETIGGQIRRALPILPSR